MDVIYQLDGQNTIVAINDDWIEFAMANGGESLVPENVIGKSIFQYICGEPTQMYFRVIAAHARLTRQTVSHRYRCDGEDVKRFMEMTITPLDNSALEVKHTILAEEPKPLVKFVYASTNASRFIKRCSICNRVNLNEQWCEDSALNAPQDQVAVVYGVCEDCKDIRYRSAGFFQQHMTRIGGGE